MKLPSLRQAAQEAGSSFVRFPSVIVSAVVGTASALILIDYEGPSGPTIFFNMLLACILGIPLLTALILLAERRHWRPPNVLLVQAAGILLLIGYAFTVPSDLTNAPDDTIIRFFILAAGLHLFAAAAPYARKGEMNGFWHYNKELFLRILTAVLYAFVLWVGLAIALAAVDNLFGVHVPGKRYPELWVFINGIFTTWFFLSGLPTDFDELERSTEYPRGLKVFAQYILFPIVLVYLLILYAYLAKIIVEWDWPQGWTSKLILGFTGTGMFSLLMLHPIAGLTENVWIRKAAQWFYIILIPLIVMLFLAVWRRVTEYGLTEGRYLAFVLGIWMVFIVGYFIISKARSIKVIPSSLCLLAFLVSFGPWGTFAVPERSQISRLKELLEKNAVLVNGTIRQSHAAVSFADARQISSIISYLHTFHGYEGIQTWFTPNLKDDSTKRGVGYKDPAAVTKMMGIEYVANWQQSAGGFVYLSSAAGGMTDIAGYDGMLYLTARSFAKIASPSPPPANGFAYRFSPKMVTVRFAAMRDSVETDTLEVDLRPFLTELLKDYGPANGMNIPSDKLSLRSDGGAMKVMICFRTLQVERREGEFRPTTIDADVFYRIRGKK